jgi:signal transduction histidine kinase
MGAASRTEEAIRHAERTRFDLAELVRSTTRAYSDTFATHRFAARVPDRRCEFSGAPDLIVQLLDKLVDNAVDFSAAGTLIELQLEPDEESFALGVLNEGEPLSEEVRARLFESMFQRRQDSPAKPHFGLGLYIVRLIAEFHRGSVFAENLQDRHAVKIGARLHSIP